MPKLPRVSGTTVIRVLVNKGFCIKRQRGSHVILARVKEAKITVVVPLHEEIDIGTLKEILRQARTTRDEFIAALR